MFSFKQFLNQIEEQAATTATTPTTGMPATAPAAYTTTPTATQATAPTGAKPASPLDKLPPQTRQKLDDAAKKNTAATRLFQTGRTKEAVDTLRKDPNFQLAMQDLTKTNAPANTSQLVNLALGGNA